jgi:hypothetical protein
MILKELLQIVPEDIFKYVKSICRFKPKNINSVVYYGLFSLHSKSTFSPSLYQQTTVASFRSYVALLNIMVIYICNL